MTETWGENAASQHVGVCQDTFINLDHNKNAQLDALNLYTFPTDQIANAILFRCDLGALPATATVLSATFEMNQVETGGDAIYTTTAHRLIHFNPVFDQADGYQWANGGAWTPNGCCYHGIPLAQADMDPAESTVDLDTAPGWKAWTITRMVQTWVAHPEENFGLMINSDPTAPYDSHRYFRSSEGTPASARPRLVITYRL